MSSSVSFVISSVIDIPVFANPSSALPLRIGFVGEGAGYVSVSGRQRYYAHPDVVRIQVDGYSRGIVRAIFSRIFLKDDDVQAPECLEGEFSFRDIPAAHARNFFLVIPEMLRSQGFSIPLLDFQKVIQTITVKGYMTEGDKIAFSQTVLTSLTRDEYEAEIERTSDVPLAISYAQSLAKEGRLMHALKWLAKAKHWGGSLGASVHLDEFWKHIGKISGVGGEIFRQGMEELADQAAQISCVKEIDLRVVPHVLRGYHEGMARFLRLSPFVERFSIGAPAALCVGKEDFTSIAEALKANKSLQIVRVVDYAIGDEGVRQIVEALSSNPEIPLKELELSIPDMTDVGAGLLLELLKAKPDLHLNLIDPFGISRECLGEISRNGGHIRVANVPFVREKRERSSF